MSSEDKANKQASDSLEELKETIESITFTLSNVSLEKANSTSSSKSEDGIEESEKSSSKVLKSPPISKTEIKPESLSALEFISDRIKKGQAKNIIFMTGAGISTSAGIPDFRTPGSGLYDNLQKFDLPYAEAIFDIDYFEDRPEPFFELASELYPGVNYRPTWSHHLIRLFELKGLLLRNFTQNIDGLEHEAGIHQDFLVESHGHFRTSTCLTCRYQTDTSFYKPMILAKKIPRCPRCSNGILKPDITFFGENLPSRFYVQKELDFDKCDLLIVMGTSLKVAPFSTLVNLVKDDVPTVLFNLYNSFNSAPEHYNPKPFDRRIVLTTCDEACWELARLLGWEEELMDLYLNCIPENKDITEPPTDLNSASLSRETK